MASSMVRASTLPSSSKRRFTFSSNGTSRWLLAFSAGGGSGRGTETYQKQREISRDAEFHGDERHHRGRSRGEREGGRQAEKDGGGWKGNLSFPPSPTFGMGQSCPPSPQTNFPAAHHSGDTSYVAAVSSPRGTTSAMGTPGSTSQGQVQSNYTRVCLWRPCSEPGLPRHRPPTPFTLQSPGSFSGGEEGGLDSVQRVGPLPIVYQVKGQLQSGPRPPPVSGASLC